ncbi:MAG: response regulator [Ramlibacter sp.]|nr:response regulator [Ramlibacter sp.]
MQAEHEDELLKAVALRNASTILKVRRQAEQELIDAKEDLERKTRQLAHSLAMMKATLDSATDGILVTDKTFRVTAFNEKFVQMWKTQAALLEGVDHPALMRVIAGYFTDPSAVVARVEEIYRTAPPTSFDLLELSDGRLLERYSRPQVVEGEVVGRVWSYRDITDHRKAEDALRDETRMLELLNSTGRELASMVDLRSAVQAVTDAGTQIIGAKFGAFFYNVTDDNGDVLLLYTLSGAPVSAFEKFGHPRATALFGPTFRGEPPIRSDDVTKDPRYGQWGPHHGMPPNHLPVRSYLAVPVVSRSGEVIGGLFFGHPEPGVFNERSQRIMEGLAAQAAVTIDNARLYEASQKASQERERLLESERAARDLAERMSALKDDFLATLSHELRTPLSAILGWVHILRRSRDRPQDVDKGLDIIERNSKVQIQLIEDLLDMNRITAGKVRLDVQPVEPMSFIEAALETARPAADAKNIRIERMLDPSAGPVPGDPGRLQQVMGNLLSNAIKFTPKGGKVQVTLERVNSHVEITVSDTGIGIKPEFVAHVFERFRQADGSTTRQYGGLGLGLSIVKSLVELHGGSVQASSREGQGATFQIHLPVMLVQAYGNAGARAHPKGAVEISRLGDLPELTGVKVLVVDDTTDARELARRMLEECGAEVLVAGDAHEALRLLEAHRPDVLLSDIGMPEVDGFELLRRVRALGPARGGGVPAIALTAFARAQDRVQALRGGFMAHLTKPVEPSELLATVASAANRSH